jgi:hypothetical protein
MDWTRVFETGLGVLVGFGGWQGIASAIGKLLGEKKLREWQGQIDARLKRLDAALSHRNYLLQRLAELEIDATVECWKAANGCLPLFNAIRPHDGGRDERALQQSYDALTSSHNTFLGVLGQHEVFLSETIAGTLEDIGKMVRLELLQVRVHPHFDGTWWEEGEKNRSRLAELEEQLSTQVRGRVAQLRAEATI